MSTEGQHWHGRARLVCSCFCIALNTLTAGSIFTYPLWAPWITRTLRLSMAQTNTVAVGAIAGEYISAVGWGALADRHGPRV